MSSPGSRIRRIGLGLVLGFLCGMAFGPCLGIFVYVACMVDGGGFDRLPRHEWVRTMVNNASTGVILLAPSLAGAVVGFIWAIHRNRRDKGAAHGASLRAE